MFDLSRVTAGVLVGGLGTRLRAVVDDRPKPLADVGGRPFLDRLLDQLDAAGIRQAVLLAGHMGERVAAVYGDRWKNLALVHVQEATPLGTGGAVENALPAFHCGEVLLLNGDSYVEVDLARLVAFHRQRPGPARATMVVVSVPDASRYGGVTLSEEGRVDAFLEKEAGLAQAWINAGVLLIDRPLLDSLPVGYPLSLESAVYPVWARNQLLWAYPAHGKFIDIGTPESLHASQTFFDSVR